jgi:predicted TIM-barrel fold metal-dependent hydrolase
MRIGSDIPAPCLAPHPVRPPRTPAPPGAWDTHAHVIGPPPWVSLRNYDPPTQSVEAYLQVLDTLGFARGVLVQISVHGVDNSTLLAALETCPERLRGVVAIPAEAPLEELERLHAAGVRGVRILTLARGGVTLESAEALAHRVAPLGWHVEFGMPGSALAEAEGLIAWLPAPVVLAHFAGCRLGPGADEASLAALLRILERPDRFVKISAPYHQARSPWAEMAPLARELARRAPQQLVWGSDWPHVAIAPPDEMPVTEALFDAFCEWLPDPELRRTILVDTPGRLYA